jgi:hypothetical protein
MFILLKIKNLIYANFKLLQKFIILKIKYDI